MNRLEVLGWWFHEEAPDAYPRPQLLVSPCNEKERNDAVAYLRAGHTVVAYEASSHCRFACGEPDMGHRDLTDGTFVWPDGLAHYVEHHDVRLPSHFVAHVHARGAKVAPFELPAPRRGLFDKAPWLAWSRAQGACLDLTGWEIPTPEDARSIARELPAVAYEAIVLCRGDTREVVLRLAAGSLVVHQLRPDGHVPRRLAGWHDWPIAT